jgi:excisionase family DNA binding protein
MSDLTCQTLSLTEAAEMLGVHRDTAYALAKEGRFPVPVLTVGRSKRVSRRQLEHFINPPAVHEDIDVELQVDGREIARELP